MVPFIRAERGSYGMGLNALSGKYNPYAWPGYRGFSDINRCRYEEDVQQRTINYHHPKSKQYDDKARLEHYLFSGEPFPDASPLARVWCIIPSIFVPE